jgi:hypothetical protein
MTAPIFPFEPNWVNGIDEIWSYRTEVQATWDGREIRRCIRDAPQRQIQYPLLTRTPARRNRIHRRLLDLLGKQVRIPVWQDASPVSVGAGATSCPVNTPGRQYYDGGEAIIWQDEQTWHVCDNLVRTTTFISWTTPTLSAITGRVAPLVTARLLPDVDGRVYTVDLEEPRVNAFLDANVLLGRLIDNEYPTYSGRIVLEHKSDEKDRSLEWSRRVETLSYEAGLTTAYPAWSQSVVAYDFQWIFSTREAFGRFLDFLHLQRGRWGWFWWDTWARDLRLTAPISPWDTVIFVDNAATGAVPPCRSALTIRLKDGTLFRRNVTAQTATSVTLDSPLEVAVAIGEIDRITWLLPVRFDTDTFRFRWETTTLVQIAARLRHVLTITDDDDESPL